MQAEERQKRIQEHLEKVEFASLEELAALAEASVSTVRRDLDVMESQKTVRRTHGGARLIETKNDEFIFSARDTRQLPEKELIGRACAEIIQPNQTIIVDAGTTCFHVAKYLEAKTPHVVTNSLPVANLFSSAPKMEVVVTGGVVYPKLGVLVGPLAVAAFSQVHADFAIMSCGGVSMDGITNSHGLLIEIQRAMMDAAHHVILCVDHTKFGRQSISRLCDLDAIGTIITDQSPAPEMQAALEKSGVELIVASPEGTEIVFEKRAQRAPRAQLAKVAASSTPASVHDREDDFID